MASRSSITILDTLILLLQSESFHVTPDKGMFWDIVWCNDVWCAYHAKLWLLVNRQNSPVSTATWAINTMEQLIPHKSTIPIICAPKFLLILANRSQTLKTGWQASLKKKTCLIKLRAALMAHILEIYPHPVCHIKGRKQGNSYTDTHWVDTI